MPESPIVIVGAGPAGLTAAYLLTARGEQPVLFEKSDRPGGISRTEMYNGYRVDIGGHRFFTKVQAVKSLWDEILGEDFLRVRRQSRIYYQGQFFDYPLNLRNAFEKLGTVEASRVVLSYLAAKLAGLYQAEESFEDWVTHRFGRRLYRMFFKTYTEKVWGIPCDRIRADWAAQRIKNLSLRRTVLHAISGREKATTLIDAFDYPVHGPGMMWERCAEIVSRRGGVIEYDTEVMLVHHDGTRVTAVTAAADGDDVHGNIPSGYVINSMPIAKLVEQMRPSAPAPVLEAARGLSYRDFIIVALVLDDAEMFSDNWIYIHSPDVRVGRIQNFKNWSAAMVPDSSTTCLGMEYFCTRSDALWSMADEDLIALAKRELDRIGLSGGVGLIDATVIRQPMAYPVYDERYMQHLTVIREYLATFENLFTVGRAGMHRYNNQDHSMLTAMLAVENIFGASHDLWDVNVERSYHEQFVRRETGRGVTEDAFATNGFVVSA